MAPTGLLVDVKIVGLVADPDIVKIDKGDDAEVRWLSDRDVKVTFKQSPFKDKVFQVSKNNMPRLSGPVLNDTAQVCKKCPKEELREHTHYKYSIEDLMTHEVRDPEVIIRK
jgi:hypothetical protein